MNKKILSNFLYQASYQLLLIIMPIVTIPIVSRALGPDGIGVYQYVFSIVGYFVLVAGLGLQNYGVREIAIVRDNKEKLSKKFWELFFLNTIISLIIIFLYIFFVSFFDNKYLFYIQGFVVLSCLFDISWFFGGLEEFKTITIRNFVVRIITVILIVLFINTKDDLVLYFIIMSSSTLLSQISLWIPLKKYVIWTPVSIKNVMKHLKPSASFFLAKVAFQFYYNVSLTLLGGLSTMVNVGLFSNGYNLIAISGSIINALNTVMIPRMSHLFSKNDDDNMILVLEKIIHIQLYFSIAITFGIIAINGQMISWFYGPGFEQLNIIVPLLAIGLVFQILQTAVAAQYLIPRKEMKAYNGTVIIGAVINFILDIILIPLIGIYGAIVGYLVSYVLLCVLRTKVLIKSTTFKFDWKQLTLNIVAGIIMWGIVYLLTTDMDSNIVTTIIQAIIGVVVYFSITLITNSNPVFSSEFIINKLKKYSK